MTLEGRVPGRGKEAQGGRPKNGDDVQKRKMPFSLEGSRRPERDLVKGDKSIYRTSREGY